MTEETWQHWSYISLLMSCSSDHVSLNCGHVLHQMKVICLPLKEESNVFFWCFPYLCLVTCCVSTSEAMTQRNSSARSPTVSALIRPAVPKHLNRRHAQTVQYMYLTFFFPTARNLPITLGSIYHMMLWFWLNKNVLGCLKAGFPIKILTPLTWYCTFWPHFLCWSDGDKKYIPCPVH